MVQSNRTSRTIKKVLFSSWYFWSSKHQLNKYCTMPIGLRCNCSSSKLTHIILELFVVLTHAKCLIWSSKNFQSWLWHANTVSKCHPSIEFESQLVVNTTWSSKKTRNTYKNNKFQLRFSLFWWRTKCVTWCTTNKGFRRARTRTYECKQATNQVLLYMRKGKLAQCKSNHAIYVEVGNKHIVSWGLMNIPCTQIHVQRFTKSVLKCCKVEYYCILQCRILFLCVKWYVLYHCHLVVFTDLIQWYEKQMYHWTCIAKQLITLI